MPIRHEEHRMNSAAHVVAMGSKGVAMTAVFLVIIIALLIAGLFSYVVARRRNASGGPGSSGGPGRAE
jgi:hypothetical protein